MSVITKKIGQLEYLTAAQITVPHCFTTRRGGVSCGHLDALNLGMHRGDDPENVAKNYAVLAGALGFDPQKLVLTCQQHGDTVRRVATRDARGLDNRDYPPCDALITCEPGTALAVFTADCTPVLLWDPLTGAVGAAHAGWRGTAADIAGKTVRAMQAEFGCDPANIRAAIGPSIGQCCFETDADVPQAMERCYGSKAWEYIRRREDKFFPDVKMLNALSLRRAGVEQIEISSECTMCRPDKYWSHRFTRGIRGTQGAIIVC